MRCENIMRTTAKQARFTHTAVAAANGLIGRDPTADEWSAVSERIVSRRAILQAASVPPSGNDIYLVDLCGALVSVVFDPRQSVIVTVLPRNCTNAPAEASRRHGKCRPAGNEAFRHRRGAARYA